MHTKQLLGLVAATKPVTARIFVSGDHGMVPVAANEVVRTVDEDGRVDSAAVLRVVAWEVADGGATLIRRIRSCDLSFLGFEDREEEKSWPTQVRKADKVVWNPEVKNLLADTLGAIQGGAVRIMPSTPVYWGRGFDDGDTTHWAFPPGRRETPIRLRHPGVEDGVLARMILGGSVEPTRLRLAGTRELRGLGRVCLAPPKVGSDFRDGPDAPVCVVFFGGSVGDPDAPESEFIRRNVRQKTRSDAAWV